MSNFWSKKLPEGYYDKILKDEKHIKKGIQKNWHMTIFENVSKNITHEMVHLDYACGPGTFIGKFINANSIGVDLSELQIKYAKTNYESKGDFYTLKDFHIKDHEDKFDVITVLGLLEFIDFKDAEKLIDDLLKLLKQGGKIIFTTPNYGGLMNILEVILNKLGPINYKNEFKTRYTKNKINKLFSNKSKNYQVEKIVNFGIFLSFLNIRISNIASSLIIKLFNGYFGFIFLISIQKED